METYPADRCVLYTGRITEQQQTRLAEHPDDKLYLEVKPLIAWVNEQFGLRYSLSGLRDLLRRIGLTYIQPRAVPSRADEQT